MIYTDKVAVGTYEMLAFEYYDPIRHPTCANFRQASHYLLQDWLQNHLSQKEMVCEVGPGKSLVIEFLAYQGHRFDNLYLIDSSPTMLAYSNHSRNNGAKVFLGNAEALPLPAGSISIIVSSLGDPYNNSLFWREAWRVLKPDGLALFTCPSYEWAVAYRTESGEDFTSAEFELCDGRHARVLSLIYPVAEQTRLIESSGFTVEEVSNAPISALDMDQLSPKLRVVEESGLSVVTSYLAKKTISQSNNCKSSA